MAKLTFAAIREQGVEFVIVLIRHMAFVNSATRQQTIDALSARFFRPIVVMDDRTYETHGRRDIVGFLSHVHPSQIPWREMNA